MKKIQIPLELLDNLKDVRVCAECGIVFVQKPHQLGPCPLKHDQKES